MTIPIYSEKIAVFIVWPAQSDGCSGLDPDTPSIYQARVEGSSYPFLVLVNPGLLLGQAVSPLVVTQDWELGQAANASQLYVSVTP